MPLSGMVQVSSHHAAFRFWKPFYWLIALGIAVFLFGFEAIQIVSTPHFQAPNVSVITQVGLTLGFYLCWIIVPRSIWFLMNRWQMFHRKASKFDYLAIALTGVILSFIHLALLACIKLIMYAQAQWGPVQFVKSTLELWLSYGGQWLVLYGFACILIARLRRPHQGQKHTNKNIEIRQNGRIISLNPEDIFWIEASGNYTQLHTRLGLFTMRKSLKAIEQSLGSADFFRVHRQALVNIRHVKSINTRSTRQSYSIEFNEGKPAPLSRRKLADFKAALHAN